MQLSGSGQVPPRLTGRLAAWTRRRQRETTFTAELHTDRVLGTTTEQAAIPSRAYYTDAAATVLPIAAAVDGRVHRAKTNVTPYVWKLIEFSVTATHWTCVPQMVSSTAAATDASALVATHRPAPPENVFSKGPWTPSLRRWP